MQPVIIDARGIPRFKANPIIELLRAEAADNGTNLHDVLTGYARGLYTQADVEQLYQLMGYSVSGYCELSFISDESAKAAVTAVKALGYPWQEGAEKIQEWLKQNHPTITQE